MQRLVQRRKSERVALAESIGVAVETPEGPPVTGTVRNVSEGGVGLALHQGATFSPGDELILRLNVEATSPFLATARVIWAQPRRDGLQDIGLQWTHRGPNRERIESLVMNAAATGRAGARAS